MPTRASAREHLRVQLRGRIDAGARARVPRGLAHERPSSRPASSSALQGSILRSSGQGLEIVEAMSARRRRARGREPAPSIIRVYPPERIAAEREQTVAVCLPARECAATVGQIVAGAVRAARAGRDRRGPRRRRRLRRRHRRGRRGGRRARLPGGRAAARARPRARQGRCDVARAVGAATASSSASWTPTPRASRAHFATGLLGPLVCEPGVSFVKAFYRRPFVARRGRASRTAAGASTTSWRARRSRSSTRELAGVRQPLAGEVAARRELLERVPFTTGYGVEIGMLIDVWRDGRAATAWRRSTSTSTATATSRCAALAPMAATVLATIAAAARRRKGACAARRRRGATPRPLERPPLAARDRRMSAARRACAACTSTSTARCSGAAPRCCTTARAAVTIDGVRAIQACLRADVEVVLMSGRRRAQVAGGRPPARPELLHLRGGRLRGARGRGALADRRAAAGRAHDRRADRALGRAGAAARALRGAPGVPRAVARRARGLPSLPRPRRRRRRSTRCWPSTGTATCASSTTASSAGARRRSPGCPHVRGYHLVPAGASKAAAVAFHRRARGYAREQTFAVGDSREDLACAAEVGHLLARRQRRSSATPRCARRSPRRRTCASPRPGTGRASTRRSSAR